MNALAWFDSVCGIDELYRFYGLAKLDRTHDAVATAPGGRAAIELTYQSTRATVNRMVKYSTLDRTFAALSDPTRREILQRLASGPATISQLAHPFDISLPGLLKHVRILEDAHLVITEKKGRTRHCRLGAEELHDAAQWIETYRHRWEGRLDRLGAYVQNQQGGQQ